MGRTLPAGQMNLVGHCGLYCGDCPGHNQRIADLARDLRRELRRASFAKTAELFSTMPGFGMFRDYDQAYAVLGGMMKLRCKAPCRTRTGPNLCAPRKCCAKHGYEGCWECDRFEDCDKLKQWEPSHGDAHIRNLRFIRRHGLAAFVGGRRHWYTTPRPRRGTTPSVPRQA